MKKNARKGVETQALNMRILPEFVERLQVHSIRTGECLSRIVEQLIRDHVPEYQITEKERAS